jgi:hypothetical protein
MKLRGLILKFSAFLLLMILLQKTGVGLLLHNSKHSNADRKEIPGESKKENAISYTCRCLDEFLTPFAETQLTDVVRSPANFNVAYKKAILPGLSIYSLLRGPPVDLM